MPEGTSGLDSEMNLEQGLTLESNHTETNLGAYYQKELARFQEGQERVDAYHLLKEQTPEKENLRVKRDLLPPRAFSLYDQFRHERLTQEAMFRGAGYLHTFKGLVEYFETTMTDYQQRYERLKKGLSREQKDEILKERAAIGWSPHLTDKDKYTELTLTKKVPFNITRKNIGALKELSEVIGEPVEVIEALRDAGVYFPISALDGRNLDSLKALIAAPFVQDVLPLLRGIPNWNRNALDFPSFYSDNTDAIDILTNLAKSPDTATTFTPDMIDKIAVLSNAISKTVSPQMLEKYVEIINNPEEFNFLITALNTKHFPSGYNAERADIFGDLEVLKNARLLSPITTLLDSGVDINQQFFGGYAYSHDQPVKTQEQVVQGLQELLNQPNIQEYLQDPAKQQFVKFVTSLTGSRISIDNIQNILQFYDKKEELVFLYDLIYKNPEDRKKLLEQKSSYDKNIPLGVVENILNNSEWVETLTDPTFSNFVNELKEKGLELTPNDFLTYNLIYSDRLGRFLPGSPLGEIFKAKELIELLGKDTLTTILESVRNGDSVSKNKLNYYMNLASWGEDMLGVVRMLKQYDVDSNEGLPQINRINDIKWMKLVQKDVLEKVPISDRRDWLQNVIELDSYAQREIKEQVDQMDVVSEPFIQRLGQVVQVFKQANAFTGNYPSELLQQEILSYQGDVQDLFKDGQPTPTLAKIFLDKKEYNYFHKFLTDNVRASFPAQVQECLMFWRDLPYNVRKIVTDQVSDFPNVSPDVLARYQKIGEMVNVIQNSSSKEVKKLQPEIIQQLWQVDNPEIYLSRIIDVFEKNNMPLVGKVFKVFEILHPPKELEAKLHNKPNLSPVLLSADNDQRYGIIYRDLLKVAIESNNPSLRNFLSAMQEGYQVIEEIEQNGVEILDLPEHAGKRESALRFLNRLNTISSASFYGRKNDVFLNPGRELEDRLLQIKESLSLKRNQRLMHRVSALFLRPLGYSSIQQVLDHMDKVKADANERNLALVENSEGGITLEAGDLLKGVKVDYLDNILLNGSVAKEYLGASADSDMTPFDTDTSMVLPEDTILGFDGAIAHSVAGSYGGLLLIIKDRGQFQKPNHGAPASYEKDKYELFSSEVHGARHYGIRTGVPSTEFDAMVALDSLAQNQEVMQRIYFTIAQNGVYIPVVDKQGKVIFTPEMFDEYRIKDDLVEEVLKSGDFKPDVLIGILEESPFIKSLYESSVGVWEGYNLKEHTTMVLSQYEKYFADRWKSPLISQEGFRMLLALHDLGKPLAVKVTGSTSEQHEYTMKFLPKIVEGMNLKSQEIEIITGIASQDYFGQYLQGVDPKTTAENIKTLAQSLGVPVTQLFQLIKMYYMCDAGSYTEDAGGKHALDNLFVFKNSEDGAKGQLSLSPAVQQKVDELESLLVLS